LLSTWTDPELGLAAPAICLQKLGEAGSIKPDKAYDLAGAGGETR
jgi:hypothetical protein